MPGYGSIDSLGDLIALPIWLLAIALLIRALLSWVVRDPDNPIVKALDTITEPILRPLRQIMPRTGMIDLTPMVAMILLFFLANIVRSAFG
ncbi:MAG: YggT family protein [Chloroflexi bacterium]|nr:YggT family protein [Chloroflexota bacterium]